MKTRIKRFGFEIEAEMSQELQHKLYGKYGKIVTDGSINFCPFSRAIKYHCSCGLSALEFVSDVMDYDRKGKTKAKRILSIFKRYQRKKEFHWNKSMGFHIHISFRPRIPVELWSKEFVDYFADEMKNKFKTAFRTRSKNRYCEFVNDESILGNVLNTDRYMAINFMPSMKEHKTIEFRIFPTKGAIVLAKYLKFTFDTIESFLKKRNLLERTFEFGDDDFEELLNQSINEKIGSYKTKPQEIEIEEKVFNSALETNIEENNV